MRISVDIGGLGQVLVEAGDGHANSPGSFLGGVHGTEALVLLVAVKGFQVALHFAADRLDDGSILKNGLELFLTAYRCPHSLRVIERETAFLNSRVAIECYSGAGDRVQDF